MHFSTLLSSALLAANVFATPLSSEARPLDISARAAAPAICTPPTQTEAKAAFWSFNKTSSCKKTGNCKEACASFLEASVDKGVRVTESIKNDMKAAMREQLKKDGWRKTSKKGHISASFFLFRSAVHKRAVGKEWAEAIDDWYKKRKGTVMPQKVYLQASGKGYWDIIVLAYY